jgi:hypothetical protein
MPFLNWFVLTVSAIRRASLARRVVHPLPRKDPGHGSGVNIGAAVLVLWFLVSLALLAVAAMREAVTQVRRSRA